MHRARRRRGPGANERGQAILEFALVLPVLLLIVLSVADLGRVYSAGVQAEAASREAASYGAFRWWYWTADNVAATQTEMMRRACSAMVGLTDYIGAADGSTCSNPEVTITMEGGGACSPPLQSNPDPSCLVRVHVKFLFHTVLRLPYLPDTVTIERDSQFVTGWQDV